MPIVTIKSVMPSTTIYIMTRSVAYVSIKPIMQSVIMLSVAYEECHDLAHKAECHKS